MVAFDPSAIADDPLRTARGAVAAGQFRDAWDDLNRAPESLRTSPAWQLLAAMTSWRLGDFRWSRTTAEQARDRYRRVGDADGEMRAENVAAAGAFAVGDLLAAERGFQRALQLADELGDAILRAHCATNLGNIAYYRAQNRLALSFYSLAAAGFARLDSWPGCIMAWINSAIVWLELGELDVSRDTADRAIEAAEREGNRRLLGAALSALAETLASAGDRALALAQAQHALELARTESDVLGEAEALRILCVIHRLAGRPADGTAAAQSALKLAMQVEQPWYLAEIQRDLGELYAAQGRDEEAKRAFAAAASHFDECGAATRAEAMRERAAR